eukprot:scaffold92068_cov18-Tisochrysis_lutea.AAC.1
MDKPSELSHGSINRPQPDPVPFGVSHTPAEEEAAVDMQPCTDGERPQQKESQQREKYKKGQVIEVCNNGWGCSGLGWEHDLELLPAGLSLFQIDCNGVGERAAKVAAFGPSSCQISGENEDEGFSGMAKALGALSGATLLGCTLGILAGKSCRAYSPPCAVLPGECTKIYAYNRHVKQHEAPRSRSMSIIGLKGYRTTYLLRPYVIKAIEATL